MHCVDVLPCLLFLNKVNSCMLYDSVLNADSKAERDMHSVKIKINYSKENTVEQVNSVR